MDASDKYRPYFKYLEVNFTVPVEKPPKIFFSHNLKRGVRLND